jgi:uncharacterized protein YcnI
VRRLAALVAACAALFAAAPAAAHVDVLPVRVEVERATEFTVRVPTERELPTTAVRVDFPDEITVYAFAPPPPGWTMRERTSPDGRTVGVVYRGGEIPVGGYLDFTFLGTPFETGATVWRAFQTYADGKVKPWTADPEPEDAISPETGPTEPGPAAAVEVVAKGALAAPAAGAPAAPTAAAQATSSDAAVWLALIAILVAVAAFLAAGYLWTTRPMKLPEDPPGGSG